MKLNLNFISTRWFLLFFVIVLPLLLMAINALLAPNVCIIMILLVWLAIGLMILYLPRSAE